MALASSRWSGLVRLFAHRHLDRRLFLAESVKETPSGAPAYYGYLLEANRLEGDDGAAYLAKGLIDRHTALVMPEDLEELADEDVVPLLPGVSPSSLVGSLVGEAEGPEKPKE